ncbi:MAG: sigma-70 family RNA polymerase sigma factor [Planctomycetia bacterium]|nr:sigma-70 family RNA polymerase sigma factor [Planctomycetia bacterium]
MVDEHGPALYRTAVRLLNDRHEAEDAVQEAFRSAWASRENFRPEQRGGAGSAGAGERAWMVSILRRRVADHWRKRTLRVVADEDAPRELASREKPTEREPYTDEVQEALGRLPPEWREALLLVVVAELTHREAADELGVPLGTVLSRVSRARERMREYLLQAARKS